MITKVTLKNFKCIKEQSYEFTDFDLLVGGNNCGKSTILQAITIWQYCIDEFSRTKRKGKKGIQIVLPNFTALPVPEFNLLWNKRTSRHYPIENGKKEQKYIDIDITVEWTDKNEESHAFGVELGYGSPQTIYVRPKGGFVSFENNKKHFPVVAYVPPFSGLEPKEKWQDKGPLREQVGKAQPGSILRNLLLRVWENDYEGAFSNDFSNAFDIKKKKTDYWGELRESVKNWFGVELNEPQYKHGVDTKIVCEYKQGGKPYDIISGGSGFHQTLTLLAFLYGYHSTTILLDEPDAHLHVNLQREILAYFKEKSAELGSQFLIATHAEEFAKGVNASQIISLISSKPKRIESPDTILTAMSDVSNVQLAQLQECPLIIYVEGESDERIIKGWAKACHGEDFINKILFKLMGGGSKEEMKEQAQRHLKGIREVIPEARSLMLFDYDSDESAFHPEPDNPVLYEWKRKNIENYLLVPEAWHCCIKKKQGRFFAHPAKELITVLFQSENLTLPPNQNWQNVKANIFKRVDGKKILFENEDSLFRQLQEKHKVSSLKEEVAATMKAEEIHDDVHEFFDKLRKTYESIEKCPPRF